MTTTTAAFDRRLGTIARQMARNPLIEYLDMLDGDVVFVVPNAIDVPIRKGVYLIYDARGLLFVGSAPDLRRRFHDELGAPSTSLLGMALDAPVGAMRFAWIVDDRPERLATVIACDRLPLCNEIDISRND